jgi:hypothetical protein
MTEVENMSARSTTRVTILLLLALVIGGTAAAAEPDVWKMAPHINAYKALELFQAGRLILLDVHHGKAGSDIVGALYVPAEKVPKVKLRIPEGTLVGVFCD